MRVSGWVISIFLTIVFTPRFSIVSQESGGEATTDTLWFSGATIESGFGIYRLTSEMVSPEIMDHTFPFLPIRFSNNGNWVVYGSAGGISFRLLNENEWWNSPLNPN
jgi:hypothetical protein